MKKLSLLITFVLVVALFVAVGSVAADSERNFRTHLSGEEAGVETLGQGQAIFRVSKDGDSIYYKLIASNIENVTMAHIHLAPPGQDGPPVVWLYPSAPPRN